MFKKSGLMLKEFANNRHLTEERNSLCLTRFGCLQNTAQNNCLIIFHDNLGGDWLRLNGRNAFDSQRTDLVLIQLNMQQNMLIWHFLRRDF